MSGVQDIGAEVFFLHFEGSGVRVKDRLCMSKTWCRDMRRHDYYHHSGSATWEAWPLKNFEFVS